MKTLHQTLASLARAPGFVAAVLVTFALGIGVNVAVFSAAWTLVLSPLPVERPDRVVTLFQTEPGNDRRQVAPANFLDWRSEAKSFSGMASYFQRSQVLDAGGGELARLEVAHVSRSFFDLLGVRAQTGRLFGSGDSTPLAVISDRTWRDRLAAMPVEGTTLRLDGEALEVVGVAPAGFDLPDETEAWVMEPRDVAGIGLDLGLDPTTLRDARYLGVYARLAPGVDLAAAQQEMSALAARLEAAFPAENKDAGASAQLLANDLARRTREPLLLLAAGALAVLLVACTNVAGLFVARHLARRRQLAVRKALGAGAGALLRSVVAESAVLAAGGSVLGLLLASWCGPLLVAALPGAEIAGRPLGAPPAIFAFALAVALLAALATAIGPAIFALRAPASDALLATRGSIGERRFSPRAALVVAQTALAVVLVAGALLLGRTLLQMIAVDPGFAAERALALRLWLPSSGELSPAERRSILSRAVDAARTVPGVEAAGASLKLPLTGSGFSAGLRVEGREFPAGQEPDVLWRAATPGYFATLGARSIAGRDFTTGDDARSAPVAIVNESLARRFWPGESALGKRIRTGIDGEETWVTVVGVVGDMRQLDLVRPVWPEMYRPLAQESLFSAQTMALVVRTGRGFSLADLRQSLRRTSPHLVLDPAESMSRILRRATDRERLLGSLIGLFGALSLLLAGIGLHGVLALVVASRRREMGLRLAVGATARDLGMLVLRRGLRQAAIGAALGLVIALACGRLIASWLWRVSPEDPLSLGGAVAALLAVALVASWLPARRAALTDPARVLRDEG